MHQRFVIAILVARAELQMRVQEQAHIVLPPGQDDVLIRRIAGQDDLVGVDVVLGERVDPRAAGKRHGQHHDRRDTRDLKTPWPDDLLGEEPRAPQRDRGVDDAEEQRRADQSKLRHEDQRKQHRGEQGAEIVERQHVRDRVAKLVAILDEAHQQRNFEADQRADDEHDQVQEELEPLRERECHEQRARGEPADHRDEDLDPDEQPRQVAAHEP